MLLKIKVSSMLRWNATNSATEIVVSYRSWIQNPSTGQDVGVLGAVEDLTVYG